MLQWDSKKKRSKGRDVLGRVIAFTWKMLHSHWQIWVEELLPKVCEDLWHTDLKIRSKKCKEIYECNLKGVMTVQDMKIEVKMSEAKNF